MELNIRQRKAVEASDPYILCLASAASGKTRVLTERIRNLIEVKNVKPEDIVAFTFTNMAADEMRERLGNSCRGAYIGTIHGYANQICLANNIDTSSLIEDFKFDDIIRKACRISRLKYPVVKHVLVDECQDLSMLEYSFIQRLQSPNWYYTGDARQEIYQFRGGSSEFIKNMYHDVKFTKYFLTQNYRNAPNIIKFAESYIWREEAIGPGSEAVKTEDGEIVEFSFAEALEEIQWSENWGSWFILTRTNDELATAIDMCEEREIPYVSFKKGDLELAELSSLIRSNKVKILTIHTAKGLEAPNVIVTGARNYCEEERKICYVAATRAMNKLYWCPAIAKRGRKKSRKDQLGKAGAIFKNTEVITF